MKTLDEVIKALWCTSPEADPETKCNDCPYKELHISDLWYVGPSCLNQMFADALHYLKEYRDKHDEILKMEEALGYCEMADNRPLTWDELRQMEGKPVWVERNEKYCYPRWFIIERIYKWDSIDDSTMIVQPNDEELFLSEHGKTWQAYRKEKE